MEKEEESLTLSEYLEKTSLVAATDDLDEGDNYVKLMTIHNSKGLEFPVVFIVGMEDEMFPSSRAEFDPKELEEERRLCYVAITRAEEKLYFCYATERDIYGRTSYMRQKSRFIDEIPSHLIEMKNAVIERVEKVENKMAKPAEKIENFNPLKAKVEDSNSPYSRGEKVSHKKFGLGIVRAVEDGQRIVIEFREGLKKFPLMAADKFITKL
jgi:DNA helicase-2/ATP-dependent DNA helicase PcrA